jgi:hypothetical protein
MAKSGTVDVGSDIERGRELCAEQDWAAAYSCLSAVDPVLLSARDLELLAGSAYMLGREDAYVDAWELAYHSHLKAGDTARAALCTWWIGDYLRFRGESARATGWFARGDSLLDQVGEACTTIAFCQAVFELGRAQEWTEAHTAWCERQSDMRAYMGACLVHRAEIMTLAGNWSAAVGDGALGALAGSARAPLGRLRLRLPLQPAHARAAREQPADDRAVGVRELARHAAAGSASDDRVGGRVSAARRSCSLELASATWHRSVRPGDHGLQRRGRPRAGRDASANYRLVRLTPFADTAPFM